MYQNEFRVWRDQGKKANKETFLDEKSKTAFNCYMLIDKDMKYIVKALRVVKDYISEMEEKGKRILLIC